MHLWSFYYDKNYQVGIRSSAYKSNFTGGRIALLISFMAILNRCRPCGNSLSLENQSDILPFTESRHLLKNCPKLTKNDSACKVSKALSILNIATIVSLLLLSSSAIWVRRIIRLSVVLLYGIKLDWAWRKNYKKNTNIIFYL